MRRPSGLSRLFALLLAAAAIFPGRVADAAQDEAVLISTAKLDGSYRVTFTWPEPATCKAVLAGKLLTLRFSRPFRAGLETLAHQLPDLIESASFGGDRETVFVKLKRTVSADAETSGNAIAVDLRPAGPHQPLAVRTPFEEPVAALPADISLAAADDGDKGKRVVLTSSEPFTPKFAHRGREVTVTLPRPLSTGDLSPIESLHPRVGGKILTLTLPEAARLEKAGEGRRIVLYITTSAARPNDKKEAAEERKIELRAAALAANHGLRLLFESDAPFEAKIDQQGREMTVTLSRPLGAPRHVREITGLNPRFADRQVTLTLPEGTTVERKGRGKRIALDLIPGSSKHPPPPAAAAAAPAAAAPPASPAPPPAPAAAPPAAAPQPVLPPGKPTAEAKAENAKLVTPSRVTAAALPEGGSLVFAPKPTAVAVFRRGQTLWIAFAGDGPLDLADLRDHGTPFVESAERVPAPGATVLRLRVAEGLMPSLRIADDSWIVDLDQRPSMAETPVAPIAETDPVRLSFQIANPPAPITLTDPEVGDTLIVVPLRDAGQGSVKEQDFVDVKVLPTLQGLAIVARSDGVTAKATPDAVEVTAQSGLLLSLAKTDSRFRQRRDRIFDPGTWAGKGDILARRRELEQAVVAAKPEERTWPRLDLARFYIAVGYGAEARGVIAAIAKDDPSAMKDPSLRLVRGVAALLDDDPEAAAADLATPLIEGDPDVQLWHAAWLEQHGDHAAAAAAFEPGLAVLPSYPPLLRNRLALAAAHARIVAGFDDNGLLSKVLADDPTEAQRLEVMYLKGRELAKGGDVDGALKEWDEVAAGNDRRARARALFAKVELQLDSGRINRSQALAALDALRFSWRGGPFEFDLLRRIGHLKIANGDYSGGLATLKQALAIMPRNADGSSTTAELKQAFADLFLGPQAASVPPLKALAVYDEYKNLMPDGDKADAITRALADRLAAVDLLDRAAALLEKQAQTRLHGVDQARVMTRVALLRLLDRKPEAALAALKAPADPGLPPELVAQRQELQARALVELGKNAEALAALNGDGSTEADKLRADIAVKMQNWAEAAKIFARLAGDLPADGKLSDAAARSVLSWATALVLARDTTGLAALRDKYGPAMAQTKFKEGFDVVAGTDTAGSTDMRELTSRLAQVSELQSFLANYRQMVAQNGVSAVN